MDENKKIGIALKSIRTAGGFTAEQSAKAIGHTSSWIFDIESGRRNVNFRDARALCYYYGVSVDYLSKMIDKL